jgi:hypothetical protein
MRESSQVVDIDFVAVGRSRTCRRTIPAAISTILNAIDVNLVVVLCSARRWRQRWRCMRRRARRRVGRQREVGAATINDEAGRW